MFHGLIAFVASLLLVLPTSPVHQVEGESVLPTTARLRLDPPGGAAIKGPTWGLPRTDPEEAFTRTGPIYPSSVAEADADDPPYYDHGCHLTGAGTVPGDNCVYGDRRGSTDVWVLGDSKVGQWFAALDAVAKREGWRLTVHTKSACPYAPSLPLPSKPTANDRRCREYNQRLEELVLQASPDVVITASGKRGPALTNAYVRTWSDLRANGTDRVVALWDSPRPAPSGPACLEPLVPDGDYLEGCAYEQGVSASATLESAAQQVEGAGFLSMGDWVCPPSALSPQCPAVIGQAMVYRQGSHLTSTYAASLTNPLHERLHRAGVADAPPEPERVERVGGTDRFDTAARLSEGYPRRREVVVTSGLNFPDALSAAARAGDAGVPVLLTRPDVLPAPTAEALRRLQPTRITVVGGEAAVSGKVEQRLKLLPGVKVDRVAGPDRYATSAEVAGTFPPGLEMVYVATGASFPDALAAAARAGHEGAPVLLTTAASLPQGTVEALAALEPEEITVVGGAGVVSEAVREELEGLATTRTVHRVSGADRYATAAELTDGYPPSLPTVYVALGTNYPDALTAAARAGDEGAPVLLVGANRIPEPTADALRRLRPGRIVVVGGSGVVSDTVRWGLEQYLG